MENVKLLFEQGGVTMYVLTFCSVLVVGVLIERAYVFRKFKSELAKFLGYFNDKMKEGNPEAVLSDENPSWLSSLIKLEFSSSGASDADIERLQAANTTRVAGYLERNLSVLATIGSIAPFIGLFGTVLGIIRAFHAISIQRCAGIAVVGAGIAEALVCTAAGLAVAIVAVVAYNAFKTQTNRILDELDVEQTELTARLRKNKGQT